MSRGQLHVFYMKRGCDKSLSHPFRNRINGVPEVTPSEISQIITEIGEPIVGIIWLIS